jgi:hypothetical protein
MQSLSRLLNTREQIPSRLQITNKKYKIQKKHQIKNIFLSLNYQIKNNIKIKYWLKYMDKFDQIYKKIYPIPNLQMITNLFLV